MSIGRNENNSLLLLFFFFENTIGLQIEDVKNSPTMEQK